MSNQDIGIANERLVYLGNGRARVYFSILNNANFPIEIISESISIAGETVKILIRSISDVIEPNSKNTKMWVEFVLPSSLWLAIETQGAEEKQDISIQIEYTRPYKTLVNL